MTWRQTKNTFSVGWVIYPDFLFLNGISVHILSLTLSGFILNSWQDYIETVHRKIIYLVVDMLKWEDGGGLRGVVANVMDRDIVVG